VAIKDNLIACYKMEEAGGANNAVDAHVNGKTLTQHGSPGSAAGKNGNCRTFVTASNQYFSRVGTDTDFQTGAVDWTISLWASFTNYVSQRPLACKDSLGSNREWTLYIETDDTPDHLQFNVFNGSTRVGQVLVDSSGLATGSTFHHVVARYTASTKELALFVNGTKTTATGTSDPAVNSTAEFEIGSLGAFYMHTGSIDEVAFWRRALSDAEVASLYNGGAGSFYDSWGAVAALPAPPLIVRQAVNRASTY